MPRRNNMSLLLFNLGLALLWMLLTGKATLLSFGVGFALGFGLLALLRPIFPGSRYVPRVFAAVQFGLIFLRELLLANLAIARAVLVGRNEELNPNFITYDVSGLSRAEIFLLSQCISLTPGTLTVEVSEDFTTLVLHVFDVPDPDAVRRAIDRKLKEPMLAFTR
jgi:multicomponent Na+:H+ antiporter subunit E